MLLCYLNFVAGKVKKQRGNKTEMDYKLEIFDQKISQGISVHILYIIIYIYIHTYIYIYIYIYICIYNIVRIKGLWTQKFTYTEYA